MPPLHRRAAAQAAFDGGFGLLQGHDPTLEGPPDVLQSTDDDDGDVPWPSVGDPPEDRPASTSSEVSSSPATSSLKPISRRATWSSKSGEGPVSSRTHLLSRALASSYSNEIRRSWRYCASASGPALPSASSRVTLPSTCGPASLSPSSPICPSHAPEPSSPACSATQALRCEGPMSSCNGSSPRSTPRSARQRFARPTGAPGMTFRSPGASTEALSPRHRASTPRSFVSSAGPGLSSRWNHTWPTGVSCEPRSKHSSRSAAA
jgi:hypothetical protein